MTNATNNAKRNDPHSPANIIPADYRFLFAYAHATTVDGWPVPGFNISLLTAQRLGRPFDAASDAQRGREIAPIADDAGRPYPMAACHKGGACDSCGAWHIEGSVFLHVPTGECVAVGHTCADKFGLDLDAKAVAAMKRERKHARGLVTTRVQRRRGLRNWVDQQRANGRKQLLADLRVEHPIVRDIRANLIKWAHRGPRLTDAQQQLVAKLANEVRNPAPVEVKVAADVQDGRQVVRGTVVSVKRDDWDNLRMTVKVTTDAGVWLAWGSVPASILDDAGQVGGLRGCEVEFTAKLTRSDRDESFAFFKRPTKGRVTRANPEKANPILADVLRDLADCAAQDVSPDYVASVERRRDLLVALGATVEAPAKPTELPPAAGNANECDTCRRSIGHDQLLAWLKVEGSTSPCGVWHLIAPNRIRCDACAEGVATEAAQLRDDLRTVQR